MVAAEPQPSPPPRSLSGRFSDLLPLVERRLPSALAGPAARRALVPIARHLPLDCLTALELRLGRARNAPVDIAVRLDVRAARALPPAARPPHLARFIRRWSEGGSPGVSWLWLEYDLDPIAGDPGRSLRPSAVAALAPGALEATPGQVLAALAGAPASADRRRRIRRCLAALPPGARLLYVFSMLSRPGRPARLEIGGLSFAALVRYLERVAGAEAARRADAMRPLTAGAEPHHLSLDIGDEVAPRFGIDCSFPRLPQRETRWSELLDLLVAAGLCRREEREALLGWTGYDTFRSAFAEWPASAGLGCAVARALSHVKLVSRPGRPAEAKAYLMLQVLPPLGLSRRPPRPPQRRRADGRGAASAR